MTSFIDMDAVFRAREAVRAAAADSLQTEAAPLVEQLTERFLARTAIESDSDEVERRGGFEACMREQKRREFLAIDARTDWLENEANRIVLAGFVARALDLRSE